MKSFPLLTALALTVGLALTAQDARADSCYGAFVVSNPSNVPIHYQVKWGDGEWKSSCVQPGCAISHYHPLDGNGQAPAPNIRFDHIAGDGQTTNKAYNVGFSATHYPNQGKRYRFNFSRCGCYLDLYSE